jgi:hypothetical protein
MWREIDPPYLLVQSCVDLRTLELLEPGEWVIVESVIVLVHAPGNPSGFILLGTYGLLERIAVDIELITARSLVVVNVRVSSLILRLWRSLDID